LPLSLPFHQPFLGGGAAGLGGGGAACIFGAGGRGVAGACLSAPSLASGRLVSTIGRHPCLCVGGVEGVCPGDCDCGVLGATCDWGAGGLGLVGGGLMFFLIAPSLMRTRGRGSRGGLVILGSFMEHLAIPRRRSSGLSQDTAQVHCPLGAILRRLHLAERRRSHRPATIPFRRRR